jgi:hypothetical protein
MLQDRFDLPCICVSEQLSKLSATNASDAVIARFEIDVRRRPRIAPVRRSSEPLRASGQEVRTAVQIDAQLLGLADRLRFVSSLADVLRVDVMSVRLLEVSPRNAQHRARVDQSLALIRNGAWLATHSPASAFVGSQPVCAVH